MPEFFIKILKPIGGFLLSIWWIWLPILSFTIFFQLWINYIRQRYWQNINWVLLEIKPPRDVRFTPKSAENIFSGLWAIYGTVATKVDKYLKGTIQDYLSLEIVGIGGAIHFYIRTPAHFRNLVEAQIYAQYPEAEVNEVEDYTKLVPQDIPNKDWDLWGTKLVLTKPDPYPIRTYQHFIDVTPQKEGTFIDPLSSVMEVLGKLQSGEQVWIQILIRPVSDEWRKKGESLVAKLLGKSAKKRESILGREVRGWAEALFGVFREFFAGGEETLSEKAKGEFTVPSLMQFLSPGEREIVKAIEDNISKKAFETKICWAYLGKNDVFSKANVGAIMGVFNQFASLSLNGFKPDKRTTTKAAYLFARVRKALRQRRIFRFLRTRSFQERGFILNIEELATIFHFPTAAVEAPATPRIEAKRGGAPSGLPV